MKNTSVTNAEIEQFMDELLLVIRGLAPRKDLLRLFLRSLLTAAEYRDTALRWRIVTQLYAKVPQRQIAQELGVSLSKITRGSQELANKNGGFNKVLYKISHD